MTTAEASALLGVERRTLIRMEQRGVLTPFRPYPSAQRRWKRAEIESLVEATR